LGRLGNLEHYACRQCGGQFSRQARKRKAESGSEAMGERETTGERENDP